MSRFTAPQIGRRRTWASIGGMQACERHGADFTVDGYATILEQVRERDELHVVGRAPFPLLDLPLGVVVKAHGLEP